MRSISFLFAVLVGCASGESMPNENGCITAGVSYNFHYSQLSGTCGSLYDQSVNIPLTGQLVILSNDNNDNCSLGDSFHYEGCSTYVDERCNLVTDGGFTTINQVGRINWLEDGSYGEGLVTFKLSSQKIGTCVSEYKVSATRLRRIF